LHNEEPVEYQIAASLVVGAPLVTTQLVCPGFYGVDTYGFWCLTPVGQSGKRGYPPSDSGLGASDDICSLQQAVAGSQQQLLELRRQLEGRTDELAAARAANRELMTQLNTRPT
jgi:hypothetical protein